MIHEQDIHVTIYTNAQPGGTLELTHIPTGLKVTQQFTGSQLQAKSKALNDLWHLLRHHYGPITEDPS